MQLDPENPLHKAGFYVDELKFGPEPRHLATATRSEVVGWLEGMFRDANLDLDAKEIADATRYYGDSLGRVLRTRSMITHSVFIDGMLHGIALATGLSAKKPDA